MDKVQVNISTANCPVHLIKFYSSVGEHPTVYIQYTLDSATFMNNIFIIVAINTPAKYINPLRS